jgi:hypothetical protein
MYIVYYSQVFWEKIGIVVGYISIVAKAAAAVQEGRKDNWSNINRFVITTMQ